MHLRLAHLSDLHFGKATYSPLQFFSKRWIGNLNLIARRRAEFVPEEALQTLLPVLKREQVTHLLLCGDLTTTSHPDEFRRSVQFVREAERLGMQVITLPGNHDCYTRRSCREKAFYRYFSPTLTSPYLHYSLDTHRVTASTLDDNLYLILLDTALATPLHSSQGYFFPEQERHLEELLKSLPHHARAIVLCHFPFFQHIPRMKQLVRGEALGRLLRSFPQVQLYLHGHTHRQTIADLRPSGFPLILDSGSCSERRGGTCHLINIRDKSMDVSLLRASAAPVFHWQTASHEAFHVD